MRRQMKNKMAVLIATMCLQMKKAWVRPMYRFCLIANPIANTILFYQMFLNSGQENFGTYVVLGAGLMGLWGCICFSSAGDINRERWEGTLSLIFVAPAGFDWIIAGKILGNTLLSLLAMGCSFLTARILFGVKAEIAHPWLFGTALSATVVAFSVVSKMIAYLFTLSRKTTLYMNCIEIPMIFVCGFIVPVEELPVWIYPVSYLLPPTWAVRLLRLAVEECVDGMEFGWNLTVLMGLVAVYMLVSKVLERVMEREIRIRASLELS